MIDYNKILYEVIDISDFINYLHTSENVLFKEESISNIENKKILCNKIDLLFTVNKENIYIISAYSLTENKNNNIILREDHLISLCDYISLKKENN